MSTYFRMTHLLYLTLLFGLSCQSSEERDNRSLDSTISKDTTNITKFYAASEIVEIPIDSEFKVTFTKGRFDSIIDEHHELLSLGLPSEPGYNYWIYGKGEFGSEQGRDNYYILYSYFLGLRQTDTTDFECRRRIRAIYSAINSIFDRIEYGGTYFGHQASRILGYAEYSVYLHREHASLPSKNYDIGKEKTLYLESLRQIIKDEISIDGYTHGIEKQQRINELNKEVITLDSLINTHFYLKRAQSFHYSNYEYY